MKRLIVNADDFGLTGGVNRAIIECHELGAVTSTTLLVGGAAAPEAASLAARHRNLGVGLHVNLTSGAPVSPPDRVRSLIGDEGRFPGLRKAIARITAGLARGSEIETEIAAQIERCRELGVEPTHVDSHHHVHAHPRVRAILTHVCRRSNIKKARGYRLVIRSPKSLAIRMAAAVPVGGGTLISPSRFAGIEAMGGTDMAGALERALAASGDTVEFMCHPGYHDEELAAATSYSEPRQSELGGIRSESFLAAARDAGARMISFRDL